jgi:Fe-Mn family superoxide dismutase
MRYPLREFPRLRGLKGLPDAVVEAHLKLYAGYVTNTNALLEKLPAVKASTPEGAELRRRFGWEVNGLRLHEYYFEALSPAGGAPGGGAKDLFARGWGSFDAWREEFAAMGKMRGVGWVITYFDRRTGALTNNWIELHQDGHPAGFKPLVVMDCWEHAFTGLARPDYVDRYLDNVDWETIEKRVAAAKTGDGE